MFERNPDPHALDVPGRNQLAHDFFAMLIRMRACRWTSSLTPGLETLPTRCRIASGEAHSISLLTWVCAPSEVETATRKATPICDAGDLIAGRVHRFPGKLASARGRFARAAARLRLSN